ncbi:hypothetical protein CAPTEDRAFT_162583 [Capitella teleta]|uniref:RNA helicase n=1 Tax=Capitella teleta TaxID=283909 RepID=R7T8Q6_CAPTE|nr:hypothetical protein CAPTEDRAFT_162583 [Capitella teleta]|eukprot:ELT87384.1 hypothetical protein CAPTEDRAFT_162583 [Capitella teleta]
MADLEEGTSGESTFLKSFVDLGLNDWLVKQCEAVGMTRPTPIQLNCVPKILSGHDCIGCAKTGSGKTAAFALPILQKLCEDPYGIFALVLTPTRELAYQIGEQFSVLGKPIGLKEAIITGGRDMIDQGLLLAQKPHVVVSTPGRLADHLRTNADVSLKKIAFLVMDEADRLLEDNFGEQLQTIFAALPKKRQTLLFSATMTDTLKELEDVALNKPFFWQSKDKVATVDSLTQQYVLMPADVKDAYLMHILRKFTEENPSSSVMIFTNTCKYCQILGLVAKEVGLECVSLHSYLMQKIRLSSLAKFKSHQVKIMFATDVASRGLDIPTVDLVINHNIPNKPKNYVHRVGRTARAGRLGDAITMVTQFDVNLVHAIEDHINAKLVEHKVDDDEVAKIVTEVSVARREAQIKLDEQDFGEKKEQNKRMQMVLEGKDPDEVARKKRKQLKEKFKLRKKKMKSFS